MSAMRARRSVPLLPAAVLVGGLAGSVAVAAAVGIGAADTAALIGLAGGASLLAALGTVVALRQLRHRSLATHVFVVAAGAVASTAAGVIVAAWFMFLSSHDLGVLATVLVLSATVAAGAALVVGRAFRSSVQAVTDQIEGLTSDLDRPAPDALVTGELRRLADLLAAAHSELVTARERTARLEASRRELISWVSHDLRSPIGSIRAMAEALEDGVVTDAADVAGYHHAIRQETERFSALVDDLFELARIEGGALTDVPFVPLHDLVSELVDAAAVRAGAADVRLVAELGAVGPELVVAADLRRALANVLDNALRHTPAGGTITVAAEPGGAGVVVVVADECGGIPADDLDRIFDVSFRGDVARSRDTGGGGLGLAIARGLLEARAGQISVRNRSAGCEFTVELPAVR